MMKQARIFCSAIVLAAVVSFSAQGAWKITKPANGETVSPLKPLQRAMAMMTEEQLSAFLDAETVKRMMDVTSYPEGISVEWQTTDAPGGYALRLADNAELTAARTLKTSGTTLTLHNLEIGRSYYFQVAALDASGEALQTTAVQSFKVEDLTPRVMNVPGVPNIRDLGGRVGLEGRMIPQGMIFRSAAFNVNSTDGGKTPGKTRMNEANLAIEREAMGLKTEIDLRWDAELGNMSASPLGSDVQYLRISSTLYGGLFTPDGYKNYQQLFPVFAKAENYPIDFHCILGADRTGSLAAVLLAVLGVSREEIVRDYCFTSLYDGFLRPPRMIHTVLDGLANCGVEGDTLSDQAMRYLLRCGVRSSQIYDFLTIVLGEGLAVPAVLEQAKVQEEIQDRFVQPLAGLAVERCVMQEETTMQNGKEVTWSLPVWHDNPLVAGGSDGQGANYFQLRNASPIATTMQFRPDTQVLDDQEYFVLAPLACQAYCAPDGGMRWSAEDLAYFRCALAAQEELLLVVKPAAGNAVPEGYQAVPWQETPAYFPYFIEVSALEQPPAIDGVLDDGEWGEVPAYLMTDVLGESVADAPQVWLATDAAHAVLYLAVQLHDETPCGETHAARDAALWTEDSIEVFLASHGSAKTYQIILNAENSIWDGVDGKSDTWNAAQLESKAVRTADGWVVEAAIPLAQFDFDGALELNVCANDNPGDQHFNLFVTRGSFHDRRSICPVLFK